MDTVATLSRTVLCQTLHQLEPSSSRSCSSQEAHPLQILRDAWYGEKGAGKSITQVGSSLNLMCHVSGLNCWLAVLHAKHTWCASCLGV